MKVEIVSNISEIHPNEWNNINLNDHPFTSYEFLFSLEESKTVNPKTGWQPQHIILKNSKNKMLAALPNYLKAHSYGEYVFDHSWANAYEKAGGRYYPKIISAIPFTPVNGPRFLYKNKNKNFLIQQLVSTIENLTITNNLSSAHINFLLDDCSELLKQRGWIERKGIQFHWENKNFKDFNEFLLNLKSNKRKMIKKERSNFINSNISITKLTGDDLTSSIWDKFYSFYLNTIDRKWGGGIFKQRFF